MVNDVVNPAVNPVEEREGRRPGDRPVLLTVDDDPAVSRAVARDLRRRYGQEYRVLRAESGADALGALRELALRGEPVAAVLADYRMPQVDGVELLEQAMDLFPTARRVLLTAYADTSAAIRAINDVDLDHYLLKPWNPPEEKLYPVLDALLESWRAVPARPADEVAVIGDRWSARSFAVRDFLARNEVPYRWLLATQPEAARLLGAAGHDAATTRLPVVLAPARPPGSDGPQVLVDPDDTALADHVGLPTRPQREFYDLAIVGGGPAGLGAAVYGASEGLRTVLVEEHATGGQAGQSSRIENYLGFPDGLSGAQLADRARRQVARFGAETLAARSVTGLESAGGAHVVRFADGGSVAAHTVLLATGVSYRTLEGPGLAELTGRGVYYGAALSEVGACAGEDVFVVGAANSAGQSAVNLARSARSVTMLVRGPDLAASMSAYLVEQIRALDNVRVLTCTEVVSARGDEGGDEGGDGDGHLRSIVLRDRQSGQEREVPASHVFVFIGALPRTAWLEGTLQRDAHGFVVAGPDLHLEDGRPPGWALDRAPYHLETSVPGVFVAGDARADSVKRVASAVGEGAMAVMLVHRYLAQS